MTPSATDESVKATRQLMRKAASYLMALAAKLGANNQSLGMINIITHPDQRLPQLNYATPRPNTAWIPNNAIESGLAHMRTAELSPRVLYIEGLYLPVFAQALIAQGLTRTHYAPMQFFTTQPIDDLRLQLQVSRRLPKTTQDTLSLEEGAAHWHSIRTKNPYHIVSLNIEPLIADQTAYPDHTQTDLILRQNDEIVGIARWGKIDQTAHIIAIAANSLPRRQKLLTAATQAAITAGCDTIFSPMLALAPHTLGFIDLGAIVCYSADNESDTPKRKKHHDDLAQPLFTIR